MAARDIEAGRAYVLLRIRDKLSQGLRVIEKRFQTFGRLTATTAGVISGASAGALAWPVKLASDMEQARVSFEVFTGSASEAKRLIEEIQTFAAETPFQFGELQDQAKLLMGFGATTQQVIPMLKLLGDVSGGNSERFQRLGLAFGQVMAKGRLMGQEVMQMTEQGFNPLSEMAKQTGKSMATLMDQMEQGKITFPMLVSALQSATGPSGRFNGMMARMSGTFAGLMSTLIDYSKMAASTVGETILPTLSGIVQRGIPVAKTVIQIVKANSAWVAAGAKVVLVVGAVAGALTAIGTGIMALGFMAGAAGTAITAVLGALSFVFSPLGALIAALAVTIYVLRNAISEAFQGLLIWASPVIEAFGRIFAAAQGAIQGIIDAFSTGQIQLAGTIAITALKAVFWQAASEIPGSATVLATSYGQAILAGRWDLLAGIAMGNVKLTLLKGWNGIANIWSAAITGLGAMWDIAVKGIADVWRATVNSIAQGILWVMEKLGLASEGAQAELAKMNAASQNQADQAFQNSMASRAAAEQSARAKRAQAEAALAGDIARMQQEAMDSAKAQGVTTASDAAAKARAELDAAIKQAQQAKEEAAKGQGGGSSFVPGLTSTSGLPKVETRGTFSAAAAVAFGGGRNGLDAVAANTSKANRLLQKVVDKPGAAFV